MSNLIKWIRGADCLYSADLDGIADEIERLTAELAVRIRDVEYWKEQAWVKPRPVDLQAVHDQVTIDTLNDAVVRLTAERDTLRTFAQYIMKAWPDGGDVDGGDLQDKAVELGLLVDSKPVEFCGEGCRCAEYYGDSEFKEGEVKCYRRTALLTGEQA